MHNPANELTIWQEIAHKNLLKTSNSFKLVVPENNILNDKSKSIIAKLNNYPSDYQRFQLLELDRMIMDQINQGNEVFIEIEDWITKLNRTSYRIFKLVDSQECDIRNSGYISFHDPSDLYSAFPWANLAQDEEFIRSEDEQDFYDNYGIWDSEDKCYIGTQIEFHKYLQNLPPFRPRNYSGEVEI